MRGPGMDFLLSGSCTACGADRPLFDVDTSRLIDYALIFRVCRYCKDRLESSRANKETAQDHWPFFVVNVHGWRTSRARQEAVAEYGQELRRKREEQHLPAWENDR
jgi:hypothetical protein